MIKRFPLSLATFLLLSFVSSSSVMAQGAITGCTNSDAVYAGVATFTGLECIVAKVLNIAISLTGLGLIVMFFTGAFQLLMSGGDPKALQTGRATITYAFFGVIISISSWFIINLVASFTGASQILDFTIIGGITF